MPIVSIKKILKSIDRSSNIPTNFDILSLLLNSRPQWRYATSDQFLQECNSKFRSNRFLYAYARRVNQTSCMATSVSKAELTRVMNFDFIWNNEKTLCFQFHFPKKYILFCFKKFDIHLNFELY